MNTYTYHKDIRTILAAVGNVFGGITLPRMVGDEENPVFDEITVPVYFSPKTRTLHELVNTSKHIKLPLLSYELKGVSYDPTRAFNKLDGYLVANRVDWTNTNHPMPTPVKLNISSAFLCRFQEDYHQYITCLFTYFNPYVEISYKHPDLDVEVRSRVIWDGNANVLVPEQFNGTDPYRFEIDANFTVESWLYKNDEIKANIIYNIPINFAALNEFSDSYEWMKQQEEIGMNTDARIKEGRPLVWYTSTEVVDVGRKDSEIIIHGDMFETVKDVAIVDMPENKERMYDDDQYKTYDVNFYAYDENNKFDEKTKHVARDDKTHYVPFEGVPAKFEILDEHRLIVKVPAAKRSGRFDVYVVGKYGYGKLSEDHYRVYRDHPEPTTFPSESNQMPNTKGIYGQKISGD